MRGIQCLTDRSIPHRRLLTVSDIPDADVNEIILSNKKLLFMFRRKGPFFVAESAGSCLSGDFYAMFMK